MKICQAKREHDGNWNFSQQTTLEKPLVLVFGDRFALENNSIYDEVRELFPDGELIFGSTSGEIMGAHVFEGTVTLTAIEFERTAFQVIRENVSNFVKRHIICCN